jgi:hypothetical protein
LLEKNEETSGEIFSEISASACVSSTLSQYQGTAIWEDCVIGIGQIFRDLARDESASLSKRLSQSEVLSTVWSTVKAVALKNPYEAKISLNTVAFLG